MAWEWSHSIEAYEAGRKNLAKQNVTDLQVMKAEWEATDWDDEETFQGANLDTEKYNKSLKRIQAHYRMSRRSNVSVKSLKEQYADWIWERAEKLRTCTNGGHEAHVCPYACHKVAW
jgi:hypothetical protein